MSDTPQLNIHYAIQRFHFDMTCLGDHVFYTMAFQAQAVANSISVDNYQNAEKLKGAIFFFYGEQKDPHIM